MKHCKTCGAGIHNGDVPRLRERGKQIYRTTDESLKSKKPDYEVECQRCLDLAEGDADKIRD